MGYRFAEEDAVLRALLDEWYNGMKDFEDQCRGIFSEKAKQYDVESPVWYRIEFPGGFLQEIRKKTDRIKQLLHDIDSLYHREVIWDDVLEELRDIHNFAVMLGSMIYMHQIRFTSLGSGACALETLSEAMEYIKGRREDQ